MKTIKARLDLIPPEALYGMAEALEDGANKYGPHDWEQGKEWLYRERVAAIMRHCLCYLRGEDISQDSKVHHMAHVMANAAMIYTSEHRETLNERGTIGKDDRPYRQN